MYLFGGLLIQFQWVTIYYCLYTLFTFCFLLFVFSIFYFFPRCENNCVLLMVLIQFQWVTTYYCLYMLFTFCFLLSVFLFSVFFPHCENNCLFGGAYLVSVGNYLLLFIYAVYFLFSSFRFFVFFFFFPLQEQTQRRLWTKNRVPLTLLLLVILFFTNISWSCLLLHQLV